MTSWIGYTGLVALALCWVPQTMETFRRGRCDVNGRFLALSMAGSFCLMLYALLQGDPVFSILNAITTVGALSNLYYKFFPRTSHEQTASGDAQ